MKITVDITKLLHEKKITKEEYNQLIKYSSKDTSSVAVNILVAFGVLGVTGGFIALDPSIPLMAILSVILAAVGVWIKGAYEKQWNLLANILLLMGSIGLAHSLTVLVGSVYIFFLIFALFLVVGLITRSGLLITLSALSINPLLSVSTDYTHAVYYLIIEQPVFTIVVYSLLSYAAYYISKRVPHKFENLSILFSKVCLFMVNLGFWVGSIWGDEVFKFEFSENLLSLIWALGLIGVAIWATSNNKRYELNIVATFGAIHFYTQWFEYFGSNPQTLLWGGIIAIIASLCLWKYNQKFKKLKS